MKKLIIPYDTFSTDSIEDLTARLETGVVHFWFLYKNPEEHDGEVLREAFGTRNMLMSFISFSDIPMDLKTPPPHVRTYFDTQRGEWRCFIKSNLVKFLPEIWVDDDFDTNSLPLSDEKKAELFGDVKTYK